jgi:hypothetical protein
VKNAFPLFIIKIFCGQTLHSTKWECRHYYWPKLVSRTITSYVHWKRTLYF